MRSHLVHLLPGVEDVILLDGGLGVLADLVVGVCVPVVHEPPEAPGLSGAQGSQEGQGRPEQVLRERGALLEQAQHASAIKINRKYHALYHYYN